MTTPVRPAAAAYQAIAAFIARQGIACSVLSGIDPHTGTIGNDLDIYVPDSNDASKIIIYACQKFVETGFQWTTPMSPIWGPRCVGMRLDDYCEVHISTTFRLGPCDLGALVPLNPIEGAFGFPFDPSLQFLKLVMKFNRAIIWGRPIWTHLEPPEFIRVNQAIIERTIGNAFSGGDAFVASVLGPDLPSTITARRSGLLTLMRTQVSKHPFRSARMLGIGLRRRALRMSSPCAPYLSVAASLPIECIETELRKRLGHAFRGIQVRTERWPLPVRRWIQARQIILVHVAANEADIDPDADVSAVLDSPLSDSNQFDELAQLILDGMVAMNRKWWTYYAAS